MTDETAENSTRTKVTATAHDEYAWAVECYEHGRWHVHAEGACSSRALAEARAEARRDEYRTAVHERAGRLAGMRVEVGRPNRPEGNLCGWAVVREADGEVLAADFAGDEEAARLQGALARLKIGDRIEETEGRPRKENA